MKAATTAGQEKPTAGVSKQSQEKVQLCDNGDKKKIGGTRVLNERKGESAKHPCRQKER